MKIRTFLLSFLIVITLSCNSDDGFDPRADANPPTDSNTNNQGRIPCENGFSDIYPCDGYDFMSNLNLAELNAGNNANDIWGWTDPSTGKEYALIGTSRGVNFVDISSPEDPTIIGRLATASEASQWRDIKVFQNHAFVVSEAQGHGMQVFDLTRLRTTTDEIQNFTADALYNEFGNAHNIVINEETGYAYAVGTQTFDGGPHFINIQNPKSPVAEGGYAEGTYTHDAQVVIYRGPDTEHQGKEIFVGSNETEIVVVDVSDKSQPILLSRTTYSNSAYTHQGWFTEDQRFFIANDELDESNFGFNTRTLVFDFSDLDDPSLHATYEGPSEAIDHNLYTKGNELFLSNYTAGMRVASISQIEDGNIVETAFFDTFPANNTTAFDGVWSVYPYFNSGNIIISDMNSGLFVVRKTGL